MVANVSASDWSADRGVAWQESMGPLEAMLAPVNVPLLNALNLDAPYQIADIGCGGGETSLAIAANAQPGSSVTGFDISPALVEAAQAKQTQGRVPVNFQVQDAGQPLSNATQFDRLTSRFGIMFFPNADQAFANIAQWLKPRGRFAFAVWGPPAENPWMSGIRSVLSNHIDLPTPEPHAPGPFRYQNTPAFVKLLEQSGFSDVKSVSWRDQLAIGGGLDAEAAAEFALTAFSVGQLLKQNDQNTVQAAQADLAELFSKHVVDEHVWMDAHVHIVTGTAP